MSTRLTYCVLLFVYILSLASSAVLTKGDKCSLQDGSDGICKLLRECTTAVQLIKKNITPVVCGYQESESIVCCKNDEVTRMINSTTTTTVSPILNRTSGDTSKQKCKEYAKYAYEKISSPTLLLKPHYTKKLVCDIQRNRLEVGTTLAIRREFPHMALIGSESLEDDNEIRWICGGSLISENFVLTAAQCSFTDIGPPKLVRVGFTNKSDSAHMQERRVSEIIAHPKYHPPAKYHDICLLRLSKNVEFNTYVRPACLHTEYYIPYVLAIASGWGAISFASEVSNDLLATVLEFYDLGRCNNTYRRNHALKDGIVDDLMICAGISKSVRTTCQGDAGGPLQIYHKESEDVQCMYGIIGITSFGRVCGLAKNTPDVFTRVSAYIEWIEDIVWPS